MTDIRPQVPQRRPANSLYGGFDGGQFLSTRLPLPRRVDENPENLPGQEPRRIEPDSLRNAIQQAQRLLRERSSTRTGEHDSGKIERIGGSDLQSFSGLGSATEMPQQFESFRPRELFAR